MKRSLVVVLSGVLCAACVSSPDSTSIGGLHKDIVIANEALPETVKDDREVVLYARFVRLFEAIPNERMRRDGMRRMAKLQLEVDGAPGMQQGQVPLDSVIALFESLLQSYPEQRNDRLLYQLAKEYDESGQQDAALSSLDRLVTQYPDTAYYDEAQFRRGEILFVQRNYQKAEQAYAAVVASGSQSKLYEQAIYKKGWSQFKQSRYDDAVDSFLVILDRYIQSDSFELSTLDRAQQDFVQDILRAISLSFSYQAGPSSADEYLSGRKKRNYEYILFDHLAKFYLQKKHYADSVKAYRTFVDRNVNHPRSPVFLMAVIDIYKQGGFSSLLIDAKKDFVQRYGVKTDFWNTQGTSKLRPVIVALETNLLELASHYHSQAQKTRSRLDYREAQRWYRSYLSSFPDSKQAAQVNFMFAEILYEDGQYEDAVLQYEKTAYDYKSHEKSGEAGYAALLSYEKHQALLAGSRQQQWHRRAIDSALRFSEKFPDHPQADKVLTRSAEKLYHLGEYEVSRSVIQKTDNRELGQSAWLILAHTEFVWEEFDKAEISYNNALKTMPVDHPERKSILEKQAVAVYRQGELSREKGDLKQAVKHFSRVKKYNPNTGIVAHAEYDQAAALIALRDWGQAATVLLGFRKSHPDHALQPEVTRKLAVVHLENGEDRKAADEYRKISTLPGDPAYQLEALWQAAELYEQAGETKTAKQVYQQFVKRFPEPLERSVEARQRLVELYDREQDEKSVAYWRKEIIKADANAGEKRTDRVRYLAAKAQFALAEPIFESYRKVALKVPLKKSLASKKKKMQQALKAYSACAAYQVAEVLTASTYRIAEIYQHLGLAIFNSERPRQLNQEELEQYDVLLEEQAYPFEEKAIEFHEINAVRMSEGLHGVWVQKSFDQLKGLLPVRYAKQEKNESIVNEIY